MSRKLFLAVLLSVFASVTILAESSTVPGTTTSSGQNNDKDDDKDYTPYDPGEFNPFLNGLRRGEVLFFGSIPITYLYCNLGYLVYSQATGNYMGSEDRNYMLLYASFSASAAVVLIDIVLGKIFD